MAGQRKSKWRGRYTNKAVFINRMGPLIERQVVVYEEDPEKFRKFLPMHLHMHETARKPSALIFRAMLYARCLIAIGRVPTAEYMWHLMAIDPADAPPYTREDGTKAGWQPHFSPGLLTVEEYRDRPF